MDTATETKRILVRTTGEERAREIEVILDPSILVADALESAGLVGYRLTRADGSHFEPGERLYDKVADGQKLLAARTDDLSAGA